MLSLNSVQKVRVSQIDALGHLLGVSTRQEMGERSPSVTERISFTVYSDVFFAGL